MKICAVKDYARPAVDLSEPEGKVWYAVIANVNAEHQCRDNLEEICRTYLPVTASIVKGGGRRQVERVSERALFPRYVLVANRRKGMFPFFLLRGVRGVESIVRCDGLPLPIKHEVVEAIMRRQAAGDFDKIKPKRLKTLEDAGYEEGQKVRSISGPFEGLPALIRRVVGGHRAEILISIFGRPTPAIVPLAELEKVA